MKFCPVVPEICVDKFMLRERKNKNNNNKNNNNNKKRSKNNKSPKLSLGDLIMITKYDYNLTIMKSPKPATDNWFKK